MLHGVPRLRRAILIHWFQWAPTLGGECYWDGGLIYLRCLMSFNGHPPLWVNATLTIACRSTRWGDLFQWAPTLVGECYAIGGDAHPLAGEVFQWAPTLVGECYLLRYSDLQRRCRFSFNGHPPLWVNATSSWCASIAPFGISVSMGTHPCG